MNASVAGCKGGGNKGGRGVKGNRGNTSKGFKKKAAGKRSGLKRATKDLLLIRNPWLQLILRKRKTQARTDSPGPERLGRKNPWTSKDN